MVSAYRDFLGQILGARIITIFSTLQHTFLVLMIPKIPHNLVRLVKMHLQHHSQVCRSLYRSHHQDSLQNNNTDS